MIRRHLIALTAVMLTCGSCAVPPKAAEDAALEGPAIRLKSRVFVPEPGLDARLAEQLAASQRRTSHVLVQFHQVPQLDKRRALRELGGLRLLDPVPDGAFFASMPADPAVGKRLLAQDWSIRWIGPILASDKVQPALEGGRSLPEHARHPENQGELMVLFFGDVSARAQQQVLTTYGARPTTRITPLNGWRVLLDMNQTMKLAGEDGVKWIEPVPAPVEDDNDGVRSTSGVDSDNVAPPGDYGLSGNGVTIAQWESTHASTGHNDYAARIVIADPPLGPFDRTYTHDETVVTNGQYDNGEAVYRDDDDSNSVTAGDLRITAVGGFAAGSVVAGGDADAGNPLVIFAANERFADTVTTDFLYTATEGIYQDADSSGNVTAGDTRVNATAGFPAGSVVAAGDGDVGQALRWFVTRPHFHSTHVAGTALGDGAQSLAAGGSANQWMGVASASLLRSYSGNPTDASGAPVPGDEYMDAAASGATISTNSWGTTHVHQRFAPNTGYEIGSQYYDAVVSGRRSDGTASGLAGPVTILGSAGNNGRPERHDETIAVNGQFDNGEGIYWDLNDDGQVSVGDWRLNAAGGFAAITQVAGGDGDIGTALANFNLNEAHDDTVSLDLNSRITYRNGEGIYLDADSSLTASAGDTRITPIGGFAAGSAVAAGDADVGTALRRFLLWGNVRVPNSAKDTIEVGSVASDTNGLAASSSRGPTDDGRLKPDVVGPGTQVAGDGGVTSTWPTGLYWAISGTSMSTPAIAGCAALLTEWYKDACIAGGPAPAALRALLVHTAEDLATIPNVGGAFNGPDFAFGFGRVRVPQAVSTIPHHLTDTAAAVGDTDYSITIGRVQDLKVTLAWDDPPWTANAAPSPVTGILQNDLDLLLIAPDGTQHTPWIANGANPFAAATRSSIAAGSPIPAAARDRRNTIEQVVVADAMPGTWTVRVTASTLNLPAQDYVVVSEHLAPQTGPCSSTPAADLWMRDNAADTGATPSSGTMWLSPDAWNRLAADGNTAHENPEFGQENYLYVNVRNASATDAIKAASVDVWLAAASTGLAWPANFEYVGRIPVGNLAPGAVRQAGPLAWFPPPPAPSNHYCFYIRAVSPQDPITIAEGASVGANARNSNNIVWRNINVVDLLSSKTVTFLVRNVHTDDARVDLLFEMPDALLEEGSVRLHLPKALDERLSARSREAAALQRADRAIEIRRPQRQTQLEERKLIRAPEEQEPTENIYRLAQAKVILQNLPLRANEAFPLRLTFESPRKEPASYEVHVSQRAGEEVVGGILYIVRTGQDEK